LGSAQITAFLAFPVKSFWNVYAALIKPQSEQITFAVEEAKPHCYVAKSSSGLPALLIETDSKRSSLIDLENLSVLFGASCQVQIDGSHQNKVLSIIQCKADDEAIQKYFFKMGEQIFETIGDKPTQAKLIEAINHLVILFRRLSSPPVKELNGLVGELIVLLTSRDPHGVIRSWRNDQYDRFDFSAGMVRLECKANGSRQRQHVFSQEQCVERPGTETLIASIFVERAPGGATLEDILNMIEERLRSTEAVLKLRSVVAETLGVGLIEALKVRFDLQLAQSSVAYYRSKDIPAIRSKLPVGVSRLRFVSDLTNVPIIDAVQSKELSEDAQKFMLFS
jgi:hypothetical protein